MLNKKLLKKVYLRRQQKYEAALVSDHFPDVSRIVIDMTYFLKPPNKVYMKRIVNIYPSSHAFFNMECFLERGYDKGFDLTPIITKQIKRHKKLVKGQVNFNGQNDCFTSTLTNISYKIKVKYKS